MLYLCTVKKNNNNKLKKYARIFKKTVESINFKMAY